MKFLKLFILSMVLCISAFGQEMYKNTVENIYPIIKVGDESAVIMTQEEANSYGFSWSVKYKMDAITVITGKPNKPNSQMLATAWMLSPEIANTQKIQLMALDVNGFYTDKDKQFVYCFYKAGWPDGHEYDKDVIMDYFNTVLKYVRDSRLRYQQ